MQDDSTKAWRKDQTLILCGLFKNWTMCSSWSLTYCQLDRIATGRTNTVIIEYKFKTSQIWDYTQVRSTAKTQIQHVKSRTWKVIFANQAIRKPLTLQTKTSDPSATIPWPIVVWKQKYCRKMQVLQSISRVPTTELKRWREQGRPPAVQPALLAVRGHRAAMFFWHWSHWFQLRCIFVAAHPCPVSCK